MTAAPRVWLALAPAERHAALQPLLDHHARFGESRFIAGDPRDLEAIAHSYGHAGATLLVIEDPEKASARSRFASPFIESVPGELFVGWLRMDDPTLAAYARRAVALHQRPPLAPRTLCLLAPRENRYLELMDEVETAASGPNQLRVYRWTAERLRRTPMAAGLRAGFGSVLFTGYGASLGWHAYGGITPEVFSPTGAWPAGDTAAVLFSLACRTGAASEPGRSGSFSDLALAQGIAGALLAPQGETPHRNTRLLAPALAAALAQGETQLRAILASVRNRGASLHHYTVIGDPALAAYSAPRSIERAGAIFAPAPDHEFSDHA